MYEIALVDLKRQNKAIEKEINKTMADVIQSANFILGHNTEKFEKDFAQFCNVKHCISLSSGTAALELALKALDLKHGDEVITVPHTFIANVEAIISAAAKPVFCEIDERTFNIDVERLKALITKKTKAIMPIDLYGHPCDFDPIMELAAKHNLTVIEDACQAHGAKYKGKMVGGIAHLTAFSFYPGKNLGAFGDAGALTTNNTELAKNMKAISNHGRLQNDKYKHELVGNNYRMDELQAAILNVKLKHLEDWVDRRRDVASKYNKYINANEVIHPEQASYAQHAYHLYVIRTKKRNQLKEFLKSKGISTGVHYPLPLHLQPALRFLGYKKGYFKVSEECANTVLSLPMHPDLKEDEIEFVSTAINKFFKHEPNH